MYQSTSPLYIAMLCLIQMVSRVQRGTQKLSLNNSMTRTSSTWFDNLLLITFLQSPTEQKAYIHLRMDVQPNITSTLLWDISNSCNDFGFKNFTLIIFEAALAKNNIFFKSTTVKYMYYFTVFNMYVKIFHYKSQTEHNPQPFLKCILKARSK